MHPAIGFEDSLGILLVLVVARHNHLALNHNLTRNTLWVRRVDTNIEILLQVFTTRAEFILLRLRSNADKRSALGHTVTHDNREVDRLQECLGFAIHRSATNDKHLQVATERLEHLLLNLQAHNLIYQRYLHRNTQWSFFEHWSNLLAIDLLQNERYRADNCRLYLLHSLDQHLRSRHLAEEIDVSSCCQWSKEVESATESVSQRQECQGTASLLEPQLTGRFINLIYCVIDICSEVINSKHYTLRIARSSRCIAQHHKSIVRNICILDIGNRKSVRITLAIVFGHCIDKLGQSLAVTLIECVIVRNREYTLHLRHCILVQTVPIGVGEEQQTAARMVYNMCNIGRSEGLHNRHYHRAIGYCSDIYRTPTRRIATYKCNFITRFDFSLIKEDMQLCHLLGKSIIRVCFTREIVRHGRHFTIIAKRLLIHFN